MKVTHRLAVLWICLITLWELSTCHSTKDCLKLHNLTSAQIEAVNPSTPVSIVPLNIKCFSRCVIDEYYGDDGKIDLQRVGNRGTQQEHIILSQCKEKYDDASDLGRCDYPYLMIQCLLEGKTSGTIVS
ncbi:uncharacterized protein LOC108103562 [Drosophila eugracilis]|uniref:uncharacterized protein LOC108103562 n=1 Tax=Drosophila eugracilis TaxID=29029 RepID=UPI0007E67B24|nr:uncharacterized protein LOC108103562 [Drosophila eugracilis]